MVSCGADKSIIFRQLQSVNIIYLDRSNILIVVETRRVEFLYFLLISCLPHLLLVLLL